MAMVYTEKYLEQIFTKEVKKRGGIALKLISPGMAGVPDRLVLIPGGRIAFIELKGLGGKLRPLQLKRKAQLEELGFRVCCVDNKELIGEVLDGICAS